MWTAAKPCQDSKDCDWFRLAAVCFFYSNMGTPAVLARTATVSKKKISREIMKTTVPTYSGPHSIIHRMAFFPLFFVFLCHRRSIVGTESLLFYQLGNIADRHGGLPAVTKAVNAFSVLLCSTWLNKSPQGKILNHVATQPHLISLIRSNASVASEE